MTEPTDAAIDTLILEHGVMGQAWPTQRQLHAFARAVLAKWGVLRAEKIVIPTDTMEQEFQKHYRRGYEAGKKATTSQPTQAQAGAVPLTDREIELIDGMIQVQLDHASRCDTIANRSMADKQKGWDMERVALLQKFKAHGIKGGQHGAEH